MNSKTTPYIVSTSAIPNHSERGRNRFNVLKTIDYQYQTRVFRSETHTQKLLTGAELLRSKKTPNNNKMTKTAKFGYFSNDKLKAIFGFSKLKIIRVKALFKNFGFFDLCVLDAVSFSFCRCDAEHQKTVLSNSSPHITHQMLLLWIGTEK